MHGVSTNRPLLVSAMANGFDASTRAQQQCGCIQGSTHNQGSAIHVLLRGAGVQFHWLVTVPKRNGHSLLGPGQGCKCAVPNCWLSLCSADAEICVHDDWAQVGRGDCLHIVSTRGLLTGLWRFESMPTNTTDAIQKQSRLILKLLRENVLLTWWGHSPVLADASLHPEQGWDWVSR